MPPRKKREAKLDKFTYIFTIIYCVIIVGCCGIPVLIFYGAESGRVASRTFKSTCNITKVLSSSCLCGKATELAIEECRGKRYTFYSVSERCGQDVKLKLVGWCVKEGRTDFEVNQTHACWSDCSAGLWYKSEKLVESAGPFLYAGAAVCFLCCLCFSGFSIYKIKQILELEAAAKKQKEEKEKEKAAKESEPLKKKGSKAALSAKSGVKKTQKVPNAVA